MPVNVTYDDHPEETSFGGADFIPFWKTSAGRPGKIGLDNLVASLEASASNVTSTPSSASYQPNVDDYNTFVFSALAANLALLAPTGSPTDAQSMIVRIKDNGSARTLSYASIYRAIGQALPSTTVANKTLYLGFKYNAVDNKWDLIAVAQEA